MDSDADVSTSTLLIGAGATIALLVAGFLVAEAVLPRYVYESCLPALTFLLVFIQVHRSRAERRRESH